MSFFFFDPRIFIHLRYNNSSNKVLSSPTSVCSTSTSLITDKHKYVTLKRIFSGGFAGACTKMIVGPLERCKVLHQIQGMKAVETQAPLHYTGILQTLRTVYKEEGFLNLWKGSGANIARVIPTYALKFTFNEFYKNLLSPIFSISNSSHCNNNSLSQDNNRQLFSSFHFFLAGAFAGISQISITYPMELVFTRLSLGKSLTSNVEYNGIFHCLSRTVKDEGFFSIYKGYTPTILTGVPFVALQFGCYGMLQQLLTSTFIKNKGYSDNDSHNNKQLTSTTLLIKLFAGALAGLVAQTITFPGDVIRKRMMADGIGNKVKQYSSMTNALMTVLRKEGTRALFDGLKVNTVRALPDAAIQFLIFDTLKSFLGF